jgi:hypothetical protein
VKGEVTCKIGNKDVVFKIAGTVAKDGVLTGTCNEAPLTGWMRDDAQMKAAFGLAEGHDWPEYLGPNGDWSSADGPVTWQWVDRMEDARTAWFGEEFQGGGRAELPRFIGYAMSAEDKKKWILGGQSSPIVGGGRVYFNTYEGSGTTVGTAGVRTYRAPMLLEGDDILHALDAASGRTLWKQVFKGQTRNMNYDKHQAIGNTGCYSDGKVYMMSWIWKLRGLDAATGELKWKKNLPQYEKMKKANIAANYPNWSVADGVLFAIVQGTG